MRQAHALQKFKSILSSLNPRQASSWWTILHAMSETKTTGSCKTHVHHYLDMVRQAPSNCTYEMLYIWNASIWQGIYMTLEASRMLSSLRNLQKVLSSRGLVKISPINFRNEHHKVVYHSLPHDLLESDDKYLCAWCECWTGLLAI